MVLALVAARLLGTHDYGIYAIASIFIIILQILMYGGIYDYIVKNSNEDIDIDTCFWMNLGFSAAGGLLIAGMAPVMSGVMHSPIMLSLMLTLAPSALLAAVASWQEALLLRQGRLTTFYGATLITETLACACGLVALLHGVGIWSLVIYRYAQIIFAGSAYMIVLRRVPLLRWHAVTAKAAMSFAGNIYAGRMVGMVAGYSADFLIGVLVNPAAAGAYRLATRLVLGVSEVVYQPINTMAWVHFSKAGHDEAAFRKEWQSLIMALSLTVWPALAGLALLSGSIIHLLVGGGWGAAVPVVAILAVGRMAALFQTFLEPMLGSRGRTAEILKFNVVAAVASLVLFAAFARFGALGAAAVQVVVVVFLAISGIVVGLRFANWTLRDLLSTLVPGITVTLATVAGASAVAYMPVAFHSPILDLAVRVSAGVAGWGLALLAILRLKIVPRRFAVL
jgi:O-antigen/teichoic acid export membrane protein